MVLREQVVDRGKQVAVDQHKKRRVLCLPQFAGDLLSVFGKPFLLVVHLV